MDDTSLPLLPDSPVRMANRPMHFTPHHGVSIDWEGFSQVQTRNDANTTLRPARGVDTVAYERSGSPSVAVLQPAVSQGKAHVDRILSSRETGQAQPHDQFLLEHQAFLEHRRREYAKRVEAEARGEVYRQQRPYSEDFMRQLPGGDKAFSIDFEARTRQVLAKPQVVGTREEIAWLHPPPIPQPVGWNGYWDLCAGHELILQVMAVSGVTPDNSPSLTAHFMYPELISCFQRLQYGAYMVLYQKNDSPHERYFYIKSLPLSNKGQYCPYLCWSVHRNAHQAMDAIPLCNVMWVTPGTHTPPLMRYALGGNLISGPFVGKRRSELLTFGALSVWVYDGRTTRSIDIVAPDPLVYSMLMKVLDDMAQLNASLDLTGSVRALQKDLEAMRAKGALVKREGGSKKSTFESDRNAFPSY
ncbi:hypothetical protein HMI55_007103 [Coelomomyces lativittatus]|nr:hypothetical protein HMI55_007103 [Coelomomyces lativittatus]